MNYNNHFYPNAYTHVSLEQLQKSEQPDEKPLTFITWFYHVSVYHFNPNHPETRDKRYLQKRGGRL